MPPGSPARAQSDTLGSAPPEPLTLARLSDLPGGLQLGHFLEQLAAALTRPDVQLKFRGCPGSAVQAIARGVAVFAAVVFWLP